MYILYINIVIYNNYCFYKGDDIYISKAVGEN